MRNNRDLTLTPQEIQSFGRADYDSTLVNVLSDAQCHKRLAHLDAAYAALQSSAPSLATSTGFDNAYAILRAVDSNVLLELMRDPSFGAWCSTATRLLHAEAHLRLPAGHLLSHLRLLGRFAVAAAMLSGLPLDSKLEFDQHGRLALSPLGMALIGPIQWAGELATIQVNGTGSLTAVLPDRSSVPLMAPGYSGDNASRQHVAFLSEDQFRHSRQCGRLTPRT